VSGRSVCTQVSADENLLSVQRTAQTFPPHHLPTDDLLRYFERDRAGTARMSATPLTSAHTLGAELERDRLERRPTRMTVAIGVLRRRESENRRAPGAPRRHLRQAIADFEAQVEAINTRLRDLTTDGPSIQTQRGADARRY
jgi:hypothetical protein